MARRSLIFSVGLAASITLSLIPITAQQKDAPPTAARKPPANTPPQTEIRVTGQPVTITVGPAPSPQLTPPPPPSSGEAGQTGEQQAARQSSVPSVNAAPAKPEEDQAARAAADYAKEANEINRTISIATIGIAALTAFALALTLFQYLTMKDSLAANKVIERASISLTYLRLDRPGSFQHPFWTVTLGLTNHGHTTAHITESKVILRESKTLPEVPTYNVEPSGTAPPLLAAGETTNWRHVIDVMEVEDVLTEAPDKTHWVYGRIRFTDVFGDNHEYGFGREWRPDDPVLQHKNREERFGYPDWPSYNYARPVKKTRTAKENMAQPPSRFDGPPACRFAESHQTRAVSSSAQSPS